MDIKKLLKKKSKKRFVIEIGTHFLKIIFYQLPDRIKRSEFKNIANLSNRETSDLIKSILPEKEAKDSSGILYFPRNLLTIGTLHLPSTDYREIAQMVAVNASRQVPYPKEEIATGWHIISKDEAGYTDVFLVILQRSLVRRYLGILAAAGLGVEDIDVASETTLAWLLNKENELTNLHKAFFILNIDYDFTDLIICENKSIFMSHLISQGQRDLLEDKAGIAKFIGEFKQVMGIISTSFQGEKLNEVLLCGTGKAFGILEKRLSEEFNFNVRSIKTEKVLSEEVSFVPLLGSIYRKEKERFDFDITEIKIRKEWKKRLKQFILLGSLLIYILLISLAIFLLQIHKRSLYLERLKLKYRVIEKESKDLGAVLKKIKLIEDVKNPENNFFYYLGKISEFAFPSCQLTNFEFEKNKKIIIRGRAVKMSDVFNFISQLENSKIFSKVETRYTKKIKEKDVQKNQFEIICYLER